MGTTAATVAFGLQAGGAAAQATGAYDASSAQQQSLQYQASIARDNMILSQDKAAMSLQDGTIQSENQGLRIAQTFGAQRANMAANGVDLGSGGANNVLTSTKLLGDRDVAQIQTNAQRQAWGYSVQAQDYGANANALNSIAKSVNPAGAAMTSLLGSATQVAPSLLKNWAAS